MISSDNESIDEVKHRLLCTKLELITARMEANNEIKKYEETVKHLYKLLKRVCQERDEARDQLQLLARNYQPSTTTSSSTIPQVDHSMNLQYNSKVKSTKVSDKSSNMAFSNCYDLSLSNEKKHSLAESSNNYSALPKQPNHQNYQHGNRIASRDNIVDGASHVIDKLVGGKPLPQKGRLLQTVTRAGPLLHTLLVAPLPQWKNPPPSSSSVLPLCSTQDNNFLSTDADNKASVDPNYGFVPTSLTLAFPGDSHGPSQLSSAFGSGLSVKNEPMSYADWDSNATHKHTIAVKKRKFL